jgi:hypothetical protein
MAQPKRPTIVGGVFGLPCPPAAKSASPEFLQGRRLLLANGRSCLHVLLQELKPRTLWLPSYLCGSILEAIPKRGVSVHYYEMGFGLKPESTDWLGKIRKRDVVLAINYFGIGRNDQLMRDAKSRGAWVVEDACQALWAQPDASVADFTIYSPRKFVGLPDGGILRINTDKPVLKHLTKPVPASASWWMDAMDACVVRAEFDRGQGDRRWFELFQKAEANQPCGAVEISSFSRFALENYFDWDAIANARGKNYRALATELADVALYPKLPTHAVPLGFPIRSEHRDRIRERLFKEQIFPPIHWPIAGIVPARFTESHRLANEILTLPCDQRYDVSTMKRIAGLVRKALASR